MEEQNQTNQNLEQESQIEQEYNPVSHEEIVESKNNLKLIIGSIVLFLVLVGGGVFLYLGKLNTKVIPEENNIQQENSIVKENKLNPEDYKITNYAFVGGIEWASICYLMGDGRQFMEYFPENYILFEDMPDEIAEDDKNMCDLALFDVDEEGYKFIRYMFMTDEDGDGLNLYLEKKYNSSDKQIDSDNDGMDDLTASQQYGPNYEAFHKQKDIVKEMKVKIESGEITNLEEALVICNNMKEDNFYEVYENCMFVAAPLAEDISYCYEAKFEGWTSYRDQCFEYFDFSNMTMDECLRLGPGTYTGRCLSVVNEGQKNFESCIKFIDYTTDKYGYGEEYGYEMRRDCFGNVVESIDDINVCEDNKEFIKYNKDYINCLQYAAKNSGKDVKDIEPTEQLAPYIYREERLAEISEKLMEYVATLEKEWKLYYLAGCYTKEAKKKIPLVYSNYMISKEDESGEKYAVREYFDLSGNHINANLGVECTTIMLYR